MDDVVSETAAETAGRFTAAARLRGAVTAGAAGVIAWTVCVMTVEEDLSRAILALVMLLALAPLRAGWVAAIVVGIGVWISTAQQHAASALAAGAVVTSFGVAMAACGGRWAVRCGVMILLGMVWLTWPMWSARAGASQRWTDYAVAMSPVFAINASISPTDAITHRPTAYEISSLGQDTSYAMPKSAWPCVGFHLAVACSVWAVDGAARVALSRLAYARQKRRLPAAAPSAVPGRSD